MEDELVKVLIVERFQHEGVQYGPGLWSVGADVARSLVSAGKATLADAQPGVARLEHLGAHVLQALQR